MKKIILLGVVLLIAGQLFAQKSKFTTVSADGSKTVYALSDIQKIVFKDNAMTVKMKSGTDATDVACVSFLLPADVETVTSKLQAFVFPNPVKTQLTVIGVEKDAKINLLNLSGTFLQSIQTQDNLTDIDVSSLQQGVYLLQIGDRIVKFVKQ